MLWKNKFSWDEEISGDLRDTWILFCKDLLYINEIKFRDTYCAAIIITLNFILFQMHPKKRMAHAYIYGVKSMNVNFRVNY